MRLEWHPPLDARCRSPCTHTSMRDIRNASLIDIRSNRQTHRAPAERSHIVTGSHPRLPPHGPEGLPLWFRLVHSHTVSLHTNTSHIMPYSRQECHVVQWCSPAGQWPAGRSWGGVGPRPGWTANESRSAPTRSTAIFSACGCAGYRGRALWITALEHDLESLCVDI